MALSKSTRTFKGKQAEKKMAKINGQQGTATDQQQQSDELLARERISKKGDDKFYQAPSSNATDSGENEYSPSSTDKGNLSDYYKSLGKDPSKTAVTRRMARDYAKEGYNVDVKKRGGLFLKIQGYRPFYDEGSAEQKTETQSINYGTGIGTAKPAILSTNPFSKYSNPSAEQLQQQAVTNGGIDVTKPAATPPVSKGKGGGGKGAKKGGLASQTGVPFIQKQIGPVGPNGEFQYEGPSIPTKNSPVSEIKVPTSSFEVEMRKAYDFAKKSNPKMTDAEALNFSYMGALAKTTNGNLEKLSDEDLHYSYKRTIGILDPIKRAQLEKELKRRNYSSWDNLSNSIIATRRKNVVYVDGKGWTSKSIKTK